jgi:acetyl-CoA carboxylase carboxyl transferase subunit beta
MNWITNFVKPKIQALIQRNSIPDNLWTKCPSCQHMLFQKDLEANLFVCNYCQHHMRIDVKNRLDSLFDDKAYEIIAQSKVIADPLKFKDTKRYSDRLKDYRNKTGKQDTVTIASGKICNQSVVVAAFDFNFMGGSMGVAAGEALVNAASLAVQNQCPFIAITASGGARMQEGILSLMQMPRSIIAVQQVKEAGLPYITILTDPTTGGVSASFAMLGDIAIAEPGCLIAFAGARVIEETIRQKLPDGFQKAEYLLAHGMVDMVVSRFHMKENLGKILSHLKAA